MAQEGKNREENKHVVYVRQDVHDRLRAFLQEHEDHITSKSRVIERAIDFYLKAVEEYGMDFRLFPQVPRDRPTKPEKKTANKRR